MGLFRTKIIDNSKTELVPYEKTVNVTEKRAPTDESIKLLREMEQKALNSVVDAIEVRTNIINACAYAFSGGWKNTGSDIITVFIKCSINGNKYTFKHDFPYYELSKVKTFENRKVRKDL